MQTPQNIPAQVVQALTQVCGPGPVALHEPRFGGQEWAYVKDCLDSTFVSSVGAYVDRFEADLARFTGAKHAVAVVNGTAALHVALLLAGVVPGDEVLIPALTFIATANAVRYCGATPHFVDSNLETLGLDPVALREWLKHCSEQRGGVCVNKQTGRPIRALLPMHTLGHPCDLAGLLAVAGEFGLALVEDAAESLGSLYQSRHTGTSGLLGTLSFNGNKTITTGGGGAILTNDTALARRAKHVTTTAKRPHSWAFEHDEVGYNYRMPNINAALGCAQLEQLPGFLQSKRRLYARYAAAFAATPEISLVAEPAGCESNYWLQAILLSEAVAGQRDEVLKATNDAGLMTRPVWTLLHRLTPYLDAPRAPLPVAESLERRLINIPSSAGLA
ncbi:MULTISPECIES: LegC family aminotransferase [unclassified Polaromonas]|uniref:LegC family aminotransferase n=1 Tax=unclassified Polaromonas TaxID=2638319 RepID=UPI0013DDFF3F|nr:MULTISPECIES: LegC family aminotransferase [unclassified Polaromonas]